MKNVSLNDLALFLLRLVAGLVLMYYGCQKLLGWFGGAGFNAQLQAFHDHLGVPPALGTLAICGEFFGGLGLILGLFTRLAAFGACCTMAVASYTHFRNLSTLIAVPSSLDPALRNPLQTPVYPLLLCVISLSILLVGAGKISIDQKLFGKRAKR